MLSNKKRNLRKYSVVLFKSIFQKNGILADLELYWDLELIRVNLVPFNNVYYTLLLNGLQVFIVEKDS